MARCIIGRLADFLNLSLVLFWGPGMVKIGFLAKYHAGLTCFFDRFLENHDFRKLILFNLVISTLDRYFYAWEHQDRTRNEKNLLGVLF